MPKRVPKRFYTSQASGRHKLPTSNEDANQDSDEAMHDGSETYYGFESEDELSATIATGSAMGQQNSKRLRVSASSSQGEHESTTTSSSHFTGAGKDAKDSDQESKDLEVQQLKSMLEANEEEISMLKQRAWEAEDQCQKEKEFWLGLDEELAEAIEDADRMRPELARKAELLMHANRANKRMSNEHEKTKRQLDKQRTKNVELTKALNEKGAKLAGLQQSMARLGRNDERPMDDEILQRFSSLRSEIMQIVRLLFSSKENDDTFDDEEEASDEDDGEELEELRVRQWVAKELCQRVFDLDAIFKFLCTSVKHGSGFEQFLRENGCTESLIKARRTAHVKACKATGNFDTALDVFAESHSEAFWTKIQDYARWLPKGVTPEGMVVEKAIVSVFQTAARLAIYLQGLPVEYEWEQATRYQDREVRKKDDEIIGTCGPDPDNNDEYQLGFVVFGGVVRGDKSTGLLADGRVRLLKNQVVIDQPGTEF